MSRYLRKKAGQCKADFVGKGNKRIYFKVLSPSGETHDVSLQFECSPCQYTAYEGARDLKICGHILAVCDAISKTDGDMERIKGIEGEKVLDVDMEGTMECMCNYCNETKHCHRITGRFGEHMCCRECLKEEFNMNVQDKSEIEILKSIIVCSTNKTWMSLMKGLHRDCPEMSKVIDERIEQLGGNEHGKDEDKGN